MIKQFLSYLFILGCLISPASMRVNTPLGTVRVIPFNDPIIPGYQKLDVQNGTTIKQYLKPLLGYWGITCFIPKGKMFGEGYGYQIDPNYDGQCAQKFIIKPKNKKLTSQLAIDTPLGVVTTRPFSELIPSGWQPLDVQNGTTIKSYLKPLLGYWGITCFIPKGKMFGEGYGYQIDPNYDGQCAQKFILKPKRMT